MQKSGLAVVLSPNSHGFVVFWAVWDRFCGGLRILLFVKIVEIIKLWVKTLSRHVFLCIFYAKIVSGGRLEPKKTSQIPFLTLQNCHCHPFFFLPLYYDFIMIS
jgi:hypothetical protein